jgi:hypothetical protein
MRLGRKSWWTFGLFVALAVAHTWPLAKAPARLSRNDNPDAVLNEWILAWVEHQAVRQPSRLLDGNIFFPDRHTLAYSEYLIVPAAMGAPLSWAGASPVLVYNLVLIAGFALTGWAGCLLVRRWTGDIASGVVAGSALAFNSHTLTHLPQLQGLHLEFLVLALLALDSLLSDPGAGAALLLALWFILQAMTSYYGLMLMLVALAASLAARPSEWAAGARRALPFLALAAAVAIVCVVPLLLPYARLGQVRPIDEVALYAAGWRDYLASPSRLHYGLWSARFFGGPTALFAGATTIALAAYAIGDGTAFRDGRARTALAFGTAGLALSFGPFMPGYALLYRLVPLFQGIRNVARFGYLTIAGLGILAGFGLARIGRRFERRRWLAGAIAAAAAMAVNIEVYSAPIEYVDAGRVSPLVAHLRDTGAIVAEFPFFPPDRIFHNAPYLLDAAANWRPMLNGYSGIVPPSYVAHATELAHFPDRRAMAALRRYGVTHVIVRYKDLADWTDNETVEAVVRSPDLRLVGTDGQIGVYVLRTADGSS